MNKATAPFVSPCRRWLTMSMGSRASLTYKCALLPLTSIFIFVHSPGTRSTYALRPLSVATWVAPPFHSNASSVSLQPQNLRPPLFSERYELLIPQALYFDNHPNC